MPMLPSEIVHILEGVQILLQIFFFFVMLHLADADPSNIFSFETVKNL